MKRIIYVLVIFSTYLASCGKSVIPAEDIATTCIPIMDSVEELSELQGSLILNMGLVFSFTENTMLQDRLPVSDMDGYYVITSDIHVSPERQKVIYINNYYDLSNKKYLFSKLMLLEGGGTRIIEDWEALGALIDWRDDQWLLFNPQEYSKGVVILFDPLIGTTKRINSSFSNLYKSPPRPTWYHSENPLPLYNSDGTLAFILVEGSRLEYNLVDIKNSNVLWKNKVIEFQNEPQWSPDGKEIAIATAQKSAYQYEIITIDINGRETQLTNLGSKYSTAIIGNFSWSPDGRKIAFWLDYQDGEKLDPKIAIMDITKGKIKDYCIGSGGTAPIWSPDGDFIAIGVWDELLSKSTVVIIDLLNEKAISIDQPYDPVGWMI